MKMQAMCAADISLSEGARAQLDGQFVRPMPPHEVIHNFGNRRIECGSGQRTGDV
jgi:hypothetical protein